MAKEKDNKDSFSDSKSSSKGENAFDRFCKKRILDIIFICLFSIPLGLELGLMDQSLSGSWFESIQDRFYINEIICATCALVSTILSVSISLYSDTIHGLKLVKFRKLRTNEWADYTLTAMIIIPIAILGVCISLFYAHLWVCAIYLNVVSLFYAIYFICKEVPLLIQNEKRINKIIASATSKRIDGQSDDLANSLDTTKDLRFVLTDIIYRDGFLQAINVIKRNDLKAICYLINISTDRLRDTKFGKLVDEPLVYKTYIQNIYEAFKFINNNDVIKDNETLSSGTIAPLYDSLYSIGKVVNETDLNTLYDTELSYIFDTLMPHKESAEYKLTRKDTYYTIVSNYALVKTLSDNSLWYVDRVYSHLKGGNDKFDCYYLIFVSIYLFYLSQRNSFDSDFKKFKKQIDSFRNNKLSESVVYLLQGCNLDSPESYANLLLSLLTYYKSISDVSDWNRKAGVSEDDIIFDELYIIAWWVGLVFNRYKEMDKDLVGSAKTILSDEQSTALDSLVQYYLNRDKKEQEELGNDASEKKEGNNKKNINGKQNEEHDEAPLPTEIDTYFKDTAFVFHNTITSLNETIDKLVKSVIGINEPIQKIFDQITSMFSFPDDSIPITTIRSKITNYEYYDDSLPYIYDGKPKYISNYEGIYQESEINKYADTFENVIDKLIIDKASSDLPKNTAPDDIKGKILILSTQLKSNRGGMKVNYGIGNNDTGEHIKDAIKFNGGISSKSICRTLTDEEINKTIDKEFIYAHSVYKPISNGEKIFFSRTEVADYVSSNYRYISFRLDYNAEVDFKKLLTPSKSKSKGKVIENYDRDDKKSNN